MSTFPDWVRMRTQSPQLIVDTLFARDLSAERTALQLRQSEVALRRTRAILQYAADSREARELENDRAVARARAALLKRTPSTLTPGANELAEATSTSFNVLGSGGGRQGTSPVQP
jgi:hypothetical protein